MEQTKRNWHFVAVNAVSWGAAESSESAISKLEKTNGYSDKLLSYTVYKIYEPMETTYDFTFWIPTGVPFSIVEDQVGVLKSPISSDLVLIFDGKTFNSVGHIDELGRLVEEVTE